MNIIQFTAALHDELNKLILPTCNSPLQAIGVGVVLSAVDYRIGQLASQYAKEASALGLVDSKTGEVNLEAAEHILLNGLQWPQQVGPFKFDKTDAEKIIAAVKVQGATQK